MEPPRELARTLSGEREAHHVRRTRGRARRKQPAEGRLPCREFLLEAAALLAERGDGFARPPSLGLEPGQRAGRLGDGGFGSAQRLARLAPVALAAVELGLERFDARPQRAQVLLAGRRRIRRRRGENDGEGEGGDQALALPCAETAAIRRATSSPSPR
jgi:hypothetical protein